MPGHGMSRISLISNEAYDSSSIWWRSRTRGEQILLILSTSFLLTIIVLTIALISGSSLEPSEEGHICLTPGCVKAAADIIKNLDQSVLPCDDFYSFACGGWIANNLIRDHRYHVSSLSTHNDFIRTQLRVLLEKPPEKEKEEPEFISIPKNLFLSCMNISEIEKKGDSPLKEAIALLGGWPVLDIAKWNSTHGQKQFDWIQFLNICRREGYLTNVLLRLSVSKDSTGSRYVLRLDQAGPVLWNKEIYAKGINDTLVGAYYKLMVESAVLLGADRDSALKEMKDVLDFEEKLASYLASPEKRRNISIPFNNEMTVKSLMDSSPGINWRAYFKSVLGRPIGETETILVNSPEYIKQMGKDINKFSPRTLANYMIWRLIIRSGAYLSTRWRNLWLDFGTNVAGKVQEEPRWERCVRSVTWGYVGLSTASLYVRSHLKDDSKAEVKKMVDKLLEEFVRILDQIDWMHDKSRTQAKEKANSMKLLIGYPQELLDNSKLTVFYRALIRENLSPTEYFKNVLILRKWKWNLKMGKIGSNVEKKDWREWGDVAIPYPYYDRRENSVIFPAGILQGNYYQKERPNYLNYGSFGFLAGHEITHGFDDIGRQYDKTGAPKNWWDKETETQYKARAKCVIDQYSNFTATEKEDDNKLNGINTQGENIADNGGLKEAYFAYKRYVRENGPESKLPGLPFDPMQLFWISAANIRCSKLRPELVKLLMKYRHHVPPKYRVHGPFMNMKEFAEDFKCPPGSPMNPSKKCTVW